MGEKSFEVYEQRRGGRSGRPKQLLSVCSLGRAHNSGDVITVGRKVLCK